MINATPKEGPIVIVGGCGFIGSCLTDFCLKRNHKVKVLSRTPPGLLSEYALANSNLIVRKVDMSRIELLQSEFEGCSVCFHLACSSLPSTSNADPILDVSKNLLGSLNILEAARISDLNRVVFVSSGGTVYGPTKSTLIDELHPTEPTCSYGITKLAVEKYFALYKHLYGLDAVVLRLANPYGQRQRVHSSQGVIAVFMSKVLKNEPLMVWGDGSVVRDYIHSDDAVEAIYRSGFHQCHHLVYNLGTGIGTSLNEIIDLISSRLQRDPEVIYKSRRSLDTDVNILSIRRLSSEMDWAPKLSLTDGISLLADYMIKHS